MNESGFDWIDSAGAGFDIALRGTLVLAAAWFLTTLLRRQSAAMRHVVWTAALGALIALPLAQQFLPSWHILPAQRAFGSGATVDLHSVPLALVAQHDERRRDVDEDFVVEDFMAASDASEHAKDPAARPTHAAATVRTDVYQANAAIPRRNDTPVVASVGTNLRWAWRISWLVGALAACLPVLLGMIKVWGLSRSCRSAPNSLQDEVRMLASNLGMNRNVEVLLSSEHEIPMTWGLFKPVLLLPASATAWSHERRKMVLTHELAHIRRGDCLTQVLAQFARALHWFNPLAWLALQRLRNEQERACDDVVLNCGTDASEYAAELLAVTARLPRQSWDAAVALAMSRTHRIESRLRSILDSACERRPISLRQVVATCCVMLIFAGVVAAAQRSGPQVAPSSTRFIALTNEEEAASDEKPAAQKTTKPEPSAAQKPPATLENAAPTAGDLAKQALDKITKFSSAPVDSRSLNEAAIQGMLQSLKDPYSSMMTAEEMKELTVQLDGKLVGIGAALRKEGEAIEVISVMPNSPAVRGGLKAQDLIVEIDGHSPATLAEAVKQIRGQAGTTVTLKILRANKPEILKLTRGEVRLPAVKGWSLNEQGEWQYWLDADQKIAFVQLTQFDQTTTEVLQKTLAGLKEQGLKGLILDLRGNGGGVLAASVDVACMFLSSGTIVEMRGRTPQENEKLSVPADHAPLLGTLPLVVLIDPTTASSAEVVAAALQHHQRALLLGERTFGKGSVQSILPLSESGPSLRLTTAVMFTPSGQSLHRTPDSKTWGVDPNEGCFVPLTVEQRALRQKNAASREAGRVKLEANVSPEFLENEAADPQLAAALKSLTAKLKTGEFAKTGRPLKDLQAEVAQRDDLVKQRNELRLKLDQLDRQLGDVR